MIERQQSIAATLADRSPRLAGMYRTALRELEGAAEEGCESARISVICHCMRELMNGLPAALKVDTIPRPNPSSGSLTNKLPRLLRENPEVDLSADQDIIPLPKAVAQAINSIITAAAQEDSRNKLNAASLVTGEKDKNHPAVRQWDQAYQFFVGWTHIDRNHDAERPLPSDADLLANIRVVEDVIEVRTGVFFENLRALNPLLDDINALVDEEEE
ncbi:MAG: hypothetical protein PGN37_12290 [Mycobacterium kyogaense]|uniref:hypothetical protein n=1 Tax=Mycobacterium kyogaense TaxID=2212479 RepID=UPI002FF96731